MEVVGSARTALADVAVTDDDVGVPGLGQPASGVSVRCEQHDVAAGQGGEVGRERLEGVAALDQHQAPGGAETGAISSTRSARSA